MRRRGVPGPIWNRPLQRFAIPQKARFPGWYGPSVDCRGGIYPARGLAATQGPRDDLRPKSRACGPVGLRNAPAGAVRASSPTGAVIPQPAVFPPFGPGVCAAARSFQSSVFLRRPRLRGRFCFAWVCAAGGRHIVGQGARGTMCARCPKNRTLCRARRKFTPPVRPLPGDAAAPRRYNGGRPGTPCVSQRGRASPLPMKRGHHHGFHRKSQTGGARRHHQPGAGVSGKRPRGQPAQAHGAGRPGHAGKLVCLPARGACAAPLPKKATGTRLSCSNCMRWTPACARRFSETLCSTPSLFGSATQDETAAREGCNIPWAILLDPTSACNLHCTGCWAAEYGNKLNLTFDELDSIITQGKAAGHLYVYLYRRRAAGAQKGRHRFVRKTQRL